MRRGVHADAADHLSPDVAGHEHDGAGVVVGLVAVVAGEEPLDLDELGTPQPVVRRTVAASARPTV